MKFPMINRISSLLQQVSLVQQVSLMQTEMETLAREEARFLELTGNAITLLSALQENGDMPQRRVSRRMSEFAHQPVSN